MINEEGNIEDWYRDELSKFEATPGKGWDELSDKLDQSDVANHAVKEENIEAWYKKEMQKYEAKPDQAVWNKLSNKLDVNNVWDRLLVSLNKYDKMIWWRNTALKSAAVLLLLLGTYITYVNYADNNELVFIGESLNDSSSSAINGVDNKVIEGDGIAGNSGHIATKNAVLITEETEENVESNSNDKLKNLKDVVVREEGIKRASENLLASKEESTTEIIAAIPNKTKITGLNKDDHQKSVQNGDLELPDLRVKTLESKEFLVKKERNKIIFNSKRFSSHFVFGMYARRLYFGLNTGFKKQYMFTSFKEDAALANYSKDEMLDFGSSIGATIGFIVSDKFNLEANVNALSTMGYKREYTFEGNTITDELNLNYTQVSVLAKQMNNKTTFDNKKYSTNFIGGVYVGLLNGASSSQYDNVKDNFKKMDFGVVLGVEQDRYLTKELVITPGIRYNQGIYNTSANLSPFAASRNFSVEFNLGIKFIFLKKG